MLAIPGRKKKKTKVGEMSAKELKQMKIR